MPTPPLAPARSLNIPKEWLLSGRDGKHYIKKVTEDGHFLILEDGSVWKSEDDSESSGWSSGDEVFVKNDKIINLSQDAEKIDASCEQRCCSIIAESNVKGTFEGSESQLFSITE